MPKPEADSKPKQETKTPPKTSIETQQVSPPASRGCSTGLGFLGGLAAFPIVIIIVILIICGLCSIATYFIAKNIDWDKLNDQTANENAIANPAKVGEYVTTKNVDWKVTSAEELGQKLISMYDNIEDAETGGKFIKVSYTVKNNADEVVNPAEPTLVDSQEREYKSYADSSYYIQNQLNYVSINPGLESNFEALYEVAEGVEGLKLKITGGGLFDPVIKYIDLGI